MNLDKVFTQIAPSWYNYRHHTIFRSELEELAQQWKSGKLLNLGCGHGADFIPFKDNFELHGMDFSLGMLKQAKRYSAKFKFPADLTASDLTALPYVNESFPYAIAVATYHHLPSNLQLPALLELKRILKPGGIAFITVWNRWQKRFWFKKELLVPWKTKEKTFHRYYNLFSYGDASKLARQAGFNILSIKPESTYNSKCRHLSKNICLTLEKPRP